MSERSESAAAAGRLAEAVRQARNADADREDVVVELREATRTRLELLATELAPVFEEVPRDIENFDFTLSSGLQPRLWIDAVAHVAMGRDRRTYRFVRDTRLGRVVLAEASDIGTVADAVTRYVAERLVERQKMMEGSALPLRPHDAEPGSEPAAQKKSRRTVLSWILLVLAGAAVGLAASLPSLWERLATMWTVP